MFAQKLLFTAVCCGVAISSQAFAQGIILNHDSLRQDLNWLNQQGVIQLSTSTWPLSGTAIAQALQDAKVSTSTQQNILEQVQKQIAAQQAPIRTQLYASSDIKNTPMAFDEQQQAQFQTGLQGNAGGENWDARLNLNLQQDMRIDSKHRLNAEGSYLAGKVWNQWLIAGQIPTWWGHGADGSLIRGDASRPVYGVTMQRDAQKAFESKWLSWIGPWQYQAFAGQLMDYTAMPKAKLLGMRVTAQPIPSLELGVSRTLQIGGGQGLSTKGYLNALIGRDNAYMSDPNYSREVDPSNQLAGFDARLNLQPLTTLPVSVYGQAIGEDEAGKLPYKFLFSAGADVATQVADKPVYLYAEWANTGTGNQFKRISYQHHIYRDGYYQQGHSLGHALGGDGEMYSLGGKVQLDEKNQLQARALHAKVNQTNLTTNKAFTQNDRLNSLEVSWTRDFDVAQATLQAWTTQSAQHGQDSGVGLKLDIPVLPNK
ncbi:MULTISPECIES: capsule assembly Wzi family protein [unclassified Acinetobacter]|uniref:capsule assembly Wzi family protein n=1 Tax=unclassified Acinetobacter TaxID=196816 RepID=UPI0035B881F8